MKINWVVTSDYILGNYSDKFVGKPIAAFDLDDTIVRPSGGKKFSDGEDDWELIENNIGTKLHNYVKTGYVLVIITNQLGITKGKVNINTWKNKMSNILDELKLDMIIIASLKDNQYRKPRPKLWLEHLDECDMSKSFYCGDAGGLPKRKVGKVQLKKDFSDSDLKFALNLGIEFIHRDELVYCDQKKEYKVKHTYTFSDEDPYEFEPSDEKEVILNVGYPASGKTFLSRKIVKKHNYAYINQDMLITHLNCIKAYEAMLKNGMSCIIDNTNLTIANRKHYIDLAKKYKFKVRCLIFDTDLDTCMHNTRYRNYITNGKNEIIQSVVYYMMRKKYDEPTLNEGIDKIEHVPFTPIFSDDKRKLYDMYYE